MVTAKPNFILFAQHGWADTGQAIAALAQSVASPDTHVVAPSLGYVKTWLRIEPLIAKVEEIAREAIAQHPNAQIRIIGHSMGGLIWLELLDRHPEWWALVESLVLVASPVGGADLGRILDPFDLGIGIARDLGKNRRAIAEKIAQFIPTLIIVGDVDGGSDGTITVESAKFRHAQITYLPGLPHAVLKNHPSVAAAILNFWAQPEKAVLKTGEPELSDLVIERLRAVIGMTDAHRRDFERSRVYITFKDGSTIRIWKNPVGVDHVFVANRAGECLYGGFVGWIHAEGLRLALEEIKREYAQM